MRVLITGHNGYLGSVMVPLLLAQGHDLVGLDTYYYENCFLEKEDNPNLHFIRKDIREISLTDLIGFEAVIHLAALSNDPLGNLEPALTYDINYSASVRLAEAAKKAGVQRFIYSSSCSVYGTVGETPVIEDSPLKPITPYAISKVRTEGVLSALADKDFSPTYMRNATIYGVSNHLRLDLVLNNLVGWAYTTGKVKILSDGSPWRPIAHIEDISQAFAEVLTAPREVIHNQAVNVGVDHENYRVRELAQIVAEVVPDCQIEYAEGAGPDPRSYRVDFTKITKILPNFKAIWNARAGAIELFAAYRNIGLTLNDFQSRKFIRLDQIKYLLETHRVDRELRWLSPTT